MKMPLATVAFLSLRAMSTAAFTSPTLYHHRRDVPPLSAQQNNDWMVPVAAVALGFTLASQAAVASPMMMDSLPWTATTTTTTTTTTYESTLLVSAEKLDFSLPSYDSIGTNQGGFGLGSEARLGQDPGNFEKSKERDAMLKAEEARLARKEAEKQAKIVRNEEMIRAAEAKKKADQQRVAELFGG
jgi:hypothetical protein